MPLGKAIRSDEVPSIVSQVAEDHVRKETSIHSDEARISHLSDTVPEQLEETTQVTSAQASMTSSKTGALALLIIQTGG